MYRVVNGEVRYGLSTYSVVGLPKFRGLVYPYLVGGHNLDRYRSLLLGDYMELSVVDDGNILLNHHLVEWGVNFSGMPMSYYGGVGGIRVDFVYWCDGYVRDGLFHVHLPLLDFRMMLLMELSFILRIDFSIFCNMGIGLLWLSLYSSYSRELLRGLRELYLLGVSITDDVLYTRVFGGVGLVGASSSLDLEELRIDVDFRSMTLLECCIMLCGVPRYIRTDVRMVGGILEEVLPSWWRLFMDGDSWVGYIGSDYMLRERSRIERKNSIVRWLLDKELVISSHGSWGFRLRS